MTHDVVLRPRPIRIGQERQTFEVLFEGQTLIEATPDPEFDACRALQARGLTGRLRTRREGSPHHAMVMSIAWGAGKRTSEGRGTGLAFRAWEPFTCRVDGPGAAAGGDDPDVAALRA